MLIAVCLVLTAGTLAASAQPGKGPGRPHDRPERPREIPEAVAPEISAQRTLDRLNPLLGLTPEQYGKLYKLLLKEETRKSGLAHPMPPYTDAAEAPRPAPGEKTPPIPHERSERPVRPHESAGRPVPPPHGDPAIRPPHEAELNDSGIGAQAEIEKIQMKTDKKVKKILTEEQYAVWKKERTRPLHDPLGPQEPEPPRPERHRHHGPGPEHGPVAAHSYVIM